MWCEPTGQPIYSALLLCDPGFKLIELTRSNWLPAASAAKRPGTKSADQGLKWVAVLSKRRLLLKLMVLVFLFPLVA